MKDNKDYGMLGYCERRDKDGNLLAFGTARNWTIVSPVKIDTDWVMTREMAEKALAVMRDIRERSGRP